ncbi:DUF4150 domain-containing protein [Pseudovibrio ascidiaceicola]|uniref:DUF4150 domain-containing protein n=1 Tax=Pseudovibrio ascidiaceicola TaxID=285279 RepID=UPI003D360DC7
MSKTPPDAYWTSTPKEAIRDNGKPIIYSTTPDVCKTPIGSSTPPIPYSIVAYPKDHANYTKTVKFTKQKVMVLRSNTTCCTGDERGSAKGVKSGTVGDICEPIDHSINVRAEGSPIIRHGDKFHMNNKNTIGVVEWVEDTTTHGDKYIQLEQATQADMSDAAPEANSEFVNTLAPQAAPLPGAAPGHIPAGLPGSTPRYAVQPGSGGKVLIGEWPGSKVGPANPSLPSSGSSFISRFSRLALPLWLIQGAPLPGENRILAASSAKKVLSGINPQTDAEQAIYDSALEHLTDWKEATYDNPFGPSSSEHDEAVREELERRVQAERAEKDDAKSKEPGIASAASNVHISHTEKDKEDDKEKCIIGPYEEVFDICPNEAHHIIPDRVFRIGKRPKRVAEMNSTDNRIPHAPTYNQVMSICLNSDDHRLGNASKDIDLEDDEPSVHSSLDPAITALGLEHDPRGTAPIGKILNAAKKALGRSKGVSEECIETAKVMTEAQVMHMLEQPGRATMMPPRRREVIKTLESGTY